jgi:hypothetical protein
LTNRRSVNAGHGYRVDDILKISAGAVEVRVVRVSLRTIFIDWPWLMVDPDSRHAWNGTIGFPRDPDHYDWRNTPWRMEPDGWELSEGNICIIGIPETEVRVGKIENYDPPADFGWLPRPEWVLGLRPLEYGDDEESGYAFYLDNAEPVEIEVVSRSS